MIDVFNFLLVPGELNARVSRLERSAFPHGVLIQCKWVERGQLGTSRIGSLPSPPPLPVIEDLDRCSLSLASPAIVGSYRTPISEFAHRVLAHARTKNQRLERVFGPFGRVHLVPAHYTTAVCGQTGVRGDVTNMTITCRACAARSMQLHVCTSLRAFPLVFRSAVFFNSPLLKQA